MFDDLAEFLLTTPTPHHLPFGNQTKIPARPIIKAAGTSSTSTRRSYVPVTPAEPSPGCKLHWMIQHKTWWSLQAGRSTKFSKKDQHHPTTTGRG
jgi:hypothetical protein